MTAPASGHRERTHAESTARLEISLVSEPSALRALEAEYRELCARSPDHQVSQSFDWVWRGWERVAGRPGVRLHTLAGRSEGRLVLVWPLVVRRHRVWQVAEWLGSATTEYCDVLVDAGPRSAPGAQRAELANWLEAAWGALRSAPGIDVIFAQCIRQDARIFPLLEAEAAALKSIDHAPFLAWSDWESWEGYFEGLSRSLRADLRRKRRRLAGQGTLAFEVVEASEDVEETLEWLIEHKLAWLRHTGTAAPWFEAPEHQAFLRAIVRDASASGHLYLARLRLDDTTIAAKLGFVYQGRHDYLVNTYDHAWRSFSPGRILMEETLRWSFEQGHSLFDFRIGREAYKFDWTAKELQVTNYWVPCTRRGRLHLRWLRSSLRSWLERIRPD